MMTPVVVQENLATTYLEGGRSDWTAGTGEPGNPGGGSARSAAPAGPAGRAAPTDGSSALPVGGVEPRRRRHRPRRLRTGSGRVAGAARGVGPGAAAADRAAPARDADR